MIRLIFSCALAFALIGCGSSPQSTHASYLLSTPMAEDPEVSIGQIRVFISDYLDASNIQIERSDGTLVPANYNHWAQSLESESTRYLATMLKVSGNPKDLKIDVEIHRFHGNESGEVSLEGTWKQTDPRSEISTDWKFFSFKESAELPGYPAFVDTHAALLKRLGLSILGER